MIGTADLTPEVRGGVSPTSGFEVSFGMSLDEIEREVILKTMDFAEGNKVRAAGILGVSVKTLYNRLEQYQRKN